jgi:hypothetical protein
MARGLAVLIGFGVLLAGGVVHGVWTNRWHAAGELDRAAGRLAALPDDAGEWKGTAQEQDAESLAISGAAAYYSRSFADPETNEPVLVILLAGKPARMAVHKPEDCYRAAGYELGGQPIKVTVTPAGQPGADLWTGLFSREDLGKGASQLRIFWTWYAAGRWEAPENPRWAFARQPVLYKLYVIRTVNTSTPIQAEPCVRLLGELLPVLNKALAED